MSSILQGSANETVASTKTNWKTDPSILNFCFPSFFQQEPHPTQRSTPEQSGSLRLRLSPSHPSGIDETSILLQGNTHTSFLSVCGPSFPSWPSLAWIQAANYSPAVHTLAWFSDSQDMCSEFSALGFPFPFQL